MKPADAKLQRWIDLLAALLHHHYGLTLAELKSIVTGYGGNRTASTVDRMFERDKDELRGLGIPIRVRIEQTEEGEAQRYHIRASEMYLPYLALMSRSSGPNGHRAIAPRVAHRPGYRSIPTLAFEPDELSMLMHAVRLARDAGDAGLTRDAESALRKLTYDLDVALGAVAVESDADIRRALPEPAAAPAVSVLGEALLRRKRVTFLYRSMRRDAIEQRTVEPYGLSFANGHWYLIARDVDADEQRKFRVSRMENVMPNEKKSQSADYDIPGDFDLATHARSREAWELGDAPAEEMVIEIRGDSGAALSVRSLGADVPGEPRRRRFHVRRLDSFVRWMMSFAGDVVPVSPPHARDAYQSAIAATLAAYDTHPDAVAP